MGDIWMSCPFGGDLAWSEAAQGGQGSRGLTLPRPTASGSNPDCRISREMLVPWAIPVLRVTERRPWSTHSSPQGGLESEPGSVPAAPLGRHRGRGPSLGLPADLLAHTGAPGHSA